LDFGQILGESGIGNWELGMLKNQGPKVLMPDFNVLITIVGRKYPFPAKTFKVWQTLKVLIGLIN
jgi:hypothetical protein